MKIWQKTIAAIATFALLFNSLAAPLTVLAQEETTTPTPEDTTIPTDTPTPTDIASPTPEDTTTPTDQPTIVPTDTATPTAIPDATPADTTTPVPEITPTPTDTPIASPTDTPISTQAPESNPTVQGPPASDQPTVTPTVTPAAPEENGLIAATVLQNTKVDTSAIDSFDVTYQTDGSATIATDKLDYSPTDSVLITGVEFIAGKTYTINITSSDDPAVNFSDSVTTNDKGELIYSYQLDGNYRPNYQVEIKDLERVVATTSFTDAPLTTIDVSNLQPSWTAAGGGGVYSVYYGPNDNYAGDSPGSTAVYSGRQAAPIYAGITIDPNDNIYEDQGLMAFKFNSDPGVHSESISTFARQTFTYDFVNQYGANPVWVYIELNKGEAGDTMYQYVPTSNPSSWHTVNPMTGAKNWQVWTNLTDGITTGPMLSISDIAAANPGKTIDRVYLTEGMGDSYHDNPNGTYAWVDTTTIGTVRYDFIVAPQNGSIVAHNFDDTNGNGIIDNGEHSEASGWQMDLYKGSNCTGTWLATGSTILPSGNYTFSNLTPDSYSVKEDLINSGYIFTTSSCQNVSLKSGQNKEVDFGNFFLGTILGEKYDDLNGNGHQDAGESGLPGWTIQLQHTNGQVIASTVTDSQGNYSFTKLGPGTYRVREVAQNGWLQKSQNPDDITIQSSSYVTGVNFGNQQLGSIKIIKVTSPSTYEDFSFTTSNNLVVGHNHSFELQGDNNPEDNSITFNNLVSGTYSVTEQPKDGWHFDSISCTGADINTDGGNTVTIQLNGQNVVCTYHNTEYGSISGIKWNDLNGNGIRDQAKVKKCIWFVCYWDWGYTEPTIPGWTINLENLDGGVLQTTVTNKDGEYIFNNVLPGKYQVCEVQQSGWTNTYPGSLCQTVTVPSGKDDHEQDNNYDIVNINFGNSQMGTVTVTKFNDENQNGVLDNGEQTLAGWTINFGNQSLVTGENGQAVFTNVVSNTYTLSETPNKDQTDWVQSGIYCQQGGADPENGFSVTVTPGANINCYIGNFEEHPSVSITKTNDKPDGIGAGQTVNYSVTLTNTGNIPVTNITIQDILPAGFTYVMGSSTGATTADPNISGSVLSWTGLGTLAAGQSFTIHYQAQTASDLANGLYTNFATCSVSKDFSTFQAEFDSVDESIQCDPAASSTVSISNGISYGGSLQGQVLGISTELPATGSPTGLFAVAVILFSSGLALRFIPVRNGKKGRKYAKN